MTETVTKPGLMRGRRGLIMGVANERSIAWSIASAIAAEGGELAFTYQNDSIAKRVKPLASSVGSDFILNCDVSNDHDLDTVFSAIKEKWGELDFVVHAIAYSDKSELKGRYADTTRENFRNTMDISCFSFTNVSRRAAKLMNAGGSLITLSYLGSVRTIPNYNVMGIAKAALEASVRYLATDLGGHGIRVNALSPGPMRTLAGSAIADARYVYRYSEQNSSLGRNVEPKEVGQAGLFLASNLSSGITGEIHYVDGGMRAIGIPRPRKTEN
jgi:enoyl-[acyl-carrier protein] reductase I